MLRILQYAGPFAFPLLALTVLIVGLIVRAALVARRSDGRTGPETKDGRAAVLFWGFVAAVLGFLGQCAALHRALVTVVAASALSPDIVAEGFAASFVTTLWGAGLLLLAGMAWLPLAWRARRQLNVATLILLSMLVTGCSSGSSQVANITDGVWAGQGGPDTFLFDLRGTPPDSLLGTVHVMRDGKMDSELTITRASYHAPDLEMFMASTNATYKGRVDAAGRRVSGGLTFAGQPGSEMDLRWMDPSDMPGFAARADGATYTYQQPAQGTDGWQTAAPDEVGLDRTAVEAMVNAVIQGDAGLIHSLAVVRSGRLVLDEYFHGYGPDVLHRLASTTKSVSSLLVGAAIDRHLISSVDEPLLPLLGQEKPADARWSDETLQDLLTMTMGLDWSEQEMDGVHGTGPDFFQKVISRKVSSAPGTKWAYASANVDLLAGVLFRATGKHADAFAEEVLFAPLGIGTYDWEYGKQDGYSLMDGSLQLRPRDLAKIGAMVAAGGGWGGKQVISKEWIDESTRAHIATGQPPILGGYGYLWWTGELPVGDETHRMILANGWGSQFIVIFPDLDLVVVTTGGNDNNGRHWDIGRVLASTLLASK